MPRPPAIDARDLAVAYRLQRDPTASVQEFTIRLLKRQVSYEHFWALRGVSFQLDPGCVLAVIGANGAGKSTLLKTVARVLPPTSGRLLVRGRVAPLIELGAGFHMDMTGYENLVLYGTILGHDPRYLRRHANEIAMWAQVEAFMDVPLRSFSSGMLARLGFAIATWAQPDVLVVDEVLSVGDSSFQERSKQRIRDLLRSGTSVLFVSHQEAVIRTMADKALWLDRGRVVTCGDTRSVLDQYAASQDLVRIDAERRERLG